jgi:hypothetical protein
MLVFRELLQNSDDAASKTVEIHFETQSYLDKKSNKNTSVQIGAYEDENDILSKLKTEPVSFVSGGVIKPWLTNSCGRYINGRSRTMGCCLERRIGTG